MVIPKPLYQLVKHLISYSNQSTEGNWEAIILIELLTSKNRVKQGLTYIKRFFATDQQLHLSSKQTTCVT